MVVGHGAAAVDDQNIRPIHPILNLPVIELKDSDPEMRSTEIEVVHFVRFGVVAVADRQRRHPLHHC